jgi:hypothetical protein
LCFILHYQTSNIKHFFNTSSSSSKVLEYIAEYNHSLMDVFHQNEEGVFSAAASAVVASTATRLNTPDKPTPEDIITLASKYGFYEYRQQINATIFLEKVIADASGGKCKVHVFHSTRGLMTDLPHPKGRRPLWRSSSYTDISTLEALLVDPRRHTGYGYRQSEDAATGCTLCGERKNKSNFSSIQWQKRSGDTQKCRVCVAQGRNKSKAQGDRNIRHVLNTDGNVMCDLLQNLELGAVSSRESEEAEALTTNLSSKQSMITLTSQCATCGERKNRSDYSYNQWSLCSEGTQRCRDCVEQSRKNNTSQCTTCGERKNRSDYSYNQWSLCSEGTQRCRDCVEQSRKTQGDRNIRHVLNMDGNEMHDLRDRLEHTTLSSREGGEAEVLTTNLSSKQSMTTLTSQCTTCGERKNKSDYSNNQWSLCSEGTQRCRDCVEQSRKKSRMLAGVKESNGVLDNMHGEEVCDLLQNLELGAVSGRQSEEAQTLATNLSSKQSTKTLTSQCATCGECKNRSDYSNNQWSLCSEGTQRCRDCVEQSRKKSRMPAGVKESNGVLDNMHGEEVCDLLQNLELGAVSGRESEVAEALATNLLSEQSTQTLTSQCTTCGERKNRSDYSFNQWSLCSEGTQRCRDCVEQSRKKRSTQGDRNIRHLLNMDGNEMNDVRDRLEHTTLSSREGGEAEVLTTNLSSKRSMTTLTSQCTTCGERKNRSDYSYNQWSLCSEGTQRCRDCVEQSRKKRSTQGDRNIRHLLNMDGNEMNDVRDRLEHTTLSSREGEEAEALTTNLSSKQSMTSQCTTCGERKNRSDYSFNQWSLCSEGTQRCRDCVEQSRKNNTSQCTTCGERKNRSDYSYNQWSLCSEGTQRCRDCVEQSRSMPAGVKEMNGVIRSFESITREHDVNEFTRTLTFRALAELDSKQGTFERRQFNCPRHPRPHIFFKKVPVIKPVAKCPLCKTYKKNDDTSPHQSARLMPIPTAQVRGFGLFRCKNVKCGSSWGSSRACGGFKQACHDPKGVGKCVYTMY